VVALRCELRYALRRLRRAPGFTAAATATLALGIGAAIAIFTLIDALLLRPLPVAASDRLVVLERDRQAGFTYGDYRRLEISAPALVELAVEGDERVAFGIGGATSRVTAKFVSSGYFNLLGRPPARGRDFAPGDHAWGAPLVAVVSDVLWRRELAGGTDLMGRSVSIAGVPATVIGVAAPGVRGTDLHAPADLFLPVTAVLQTTTLPGNAMSYYFGEVGDREYSPSAWLRVIARLRPGIERAAAQAALDVTLVPIQSAAVPSRFRPDTARFVTLLAVAVAAVLAIAWANLAGLLLARNERRRREMGVRLALGGAPARLMGLVLIEGLVLAILGGAVGLWVAHGMLRVLVPRRLAGAVDLSTVDLSLGFRAWLFMLAVSVLTAVAVGLVPARRAARIDVLSALKLGVSAAPSTQRWRGALVAGQVALSFVLAIGAGLFVRSLRAGLSTDVGFDAERVVVAEVDLRLSRYDTGRTAAFFEAFAERLRAFPAVAEASYGSAPLGGSIGSNPWIEVDGGRHELSQSVEVLQAGPGYFHTLGMPILRGRELDGRDGEGAPAVVVVNEALATRFWAERDPVGHRLSCRPWLADGIVVGVVRDATYKRLGESGRLAVFVPWQQSRSFGGSVGLVRSRVDPAVVAGIVRSELRAMTPDLPILGVAPASERISQVLAPQRLGSWLLGGFALAGLVLAVVGTYGLVAYVVTQRTHEIGIRVALGADATDVLGLILMRGLRAPLLGVVIGLAGSLWGARFVDRFLFGIRPLDPLTFVVCAIGLLVTAIVASFIPARAALRVDPVVALRAE
jgi:putative ABC transport system permease protein